MRSPVRSTPGAPAPSEPPDAPPLQLDELTQRCLGSMALVERLLASFEQRFPVEVSDIAQCLNVGDVARLVRSAHQLKGAAANMSAPILRSILEQVEHAARAEQLSPIAGYLDQLQAEWQRFCRYRAGETSAPVGQSQPSAIVDAAVIPPPENKPCGS